MRRCGLKHGHCSEQCHGVVPGNIDIIGCTDITATLGCVYKHPESDLDRMKALLTKAGANVRSWRINEYVAKDQTVVKFEGYVMVHGAEDDGPYTEYLFDLTGSIIAGGATTYYSRGFNVLESA